VAALKRLQVINTTCSVDLKRLLLQQKQPPTAALMRLRVINLNMCPQRYPARGAHVAVTDLNVLPDALVR
jgi:hypothetical protein